MPASLVVESREQQNAITKSKMEDLKQKIEQLSLKKKGEFC
jgi:hypothetical protein